MRRGEYCFVGIHQGIIIAMVWVAFPGTPTSTELPFQLSPGEAYYWGAYCVPEYRSLGVTQAVGTTLNLYLQDQGLQYKYQLTERNNSSALALFEKVGKNKKIGRVISIRILKWRWQRYIPNILP
jgi:hypothetical protein